MEAGVQMPSENKPAIAKGQKSKPEPAIVVSHVSMLFKRAKDEATSVKELLVRAVRGQNHYEMFKALDDINLTIQKGEVVGIIGTTGSGKSTLLKSILGLVPLKCGSVSFGPEVHRKRLGYLPQQTNIQKDFPASVYEVVLSGCLNRRGLKPFYSKADKEQAVQHMERLGIGDFNQRSFSALSGGQQQRLCIARAISVKPDIVLMDEPASALDPIATAQLEETMLELKKDYTIVIVIHSMQQAARASDYTGFFYLGNLIEYDKTSNIFQNAKLQSTNDYVSGHFG